MLKETLLLILAHVDLAAAHPTSTEVVDYVVIGAGVGGSVAAGTIYEGRRLVEPVRLVRAHRLPPVVPHVERSLSHRRRGALPRELHRAAAVNAAAAAAALARP